MKQVHRHRETGPPQVLDVIAENKTAKTVDLAYPGTEEIIIHDCLLVDIKDARPGSASLIIAEKPQKAAKKVAAPESPSGNDEAGEEGEKTEEAPT
jgi:hypothetical protein